MHCITALLTSLISQALLQAALDKKEGDFTSCMLQYEFWSLPVSSREAQRQFVQCQPVATTATGNWERHKCKHARSIQDCHWHTSLCNGRHRGMALAQAYQVGCLATAAGKASREASRLPSLAICSRFQCHHPWLFF
jgi:hypothetical protein